MIKMRVIELLAAASRKTFKEAAAFYEEMDNSENGRTFFKLLNAIHAEGIQEGIERAPVIGLPEDRQQVIYALQRAESALRAQSNALMAQMDYSAEFPGEDADRMLEAIALVRSPILTPKPLGEDGPILPAQG